MASIEEWSRIFLLAFVFLAFSYLFSIRYQGATGKASVMAIVAGKWAPLFWVMVVALGTALPAGVALGTWVAGLSIPTALIYTLIILELLGDLALRYCLLRCGLYGPLIPATSYTS
ncbi:NrfD/PsrC family molybdoenzyme membrane anchor subunit [Chloroflexota bacterium]